MFNYCYYICNIKWEMHKICLSDELSHASFISSIYKCHTHLYKMLICYFNIFSYSSLYKILYYWDVVLYILMKLSLLYLFLSPLSFINGKPDEARTFILIPCSWWGKMYCMLLTHLLLPNIVWAATVPQLNFH